MSSKCPISAFIITQNEADRIERAIASVRGLVEEIIVIDSGSTDDTMEISEMAGARVIYHAWAGYGLQKRFGEDQCKHRWLLNLDADETLSPELADEIRQLFTYGEPPMAAYRLRIRDLLPGEIKLAPLAHTNYALRLYNRDKARFSDSPVHDSVIVREGGTQMLRHPVFHRSFRSFSHAIAKLNEYSNAQAEHLLTKGMPFAKLRLFTEFPLSFLKAYFLRLYVLRGTRGFIYAILYAHFRVMRIAKYLELRPRY